MEFTELAPEQQVRALADTLKFLAENDCPSLETAAERMAAPADELWGRVLRDAGLPATGVPWDLIGLHRAQSARLGSRRAGVLRLMQHEAGTTEAEVLAATGWTRCVGTLRRTARDMMLMFAVTETATGMQRYYAIPPDELEAFRARRSAEVLVEADRPDTIRLGGGRVHKVTLGHLIEAGYLRPPLELEAHSVGHRFAARVEADGTIAFDGRSFPSPSSAGSAATGEIACPGWAFWHARDPVTGEANPLRDLRQLYLDNYGN